MKNPSMDRLFRQRVRERIRQITPELFAEKVRESTSRLSLLKNLGLPLDIEAVRFVKSEIVRLSVDTSHFYQKSKSDQDSKEPK